MPSCDDSLDCEVIGISKHGNLKGLNNNQVNIFFQSLRGAKAAQHTIAIAQSRQLRLEGAVFHWAS
jgi:hypothetical protein